MKILEDASKFKRVNIEEGKAFQSFDLYRRTNYVSSKV